MMFILGSDFVYTLVLKSIAGFSAAPFSGKVPLKVAFTDMSIGNPVQWKWNFGDGTLSTEKNSVHTYKKVGEYTVTLTVKKSPEASKLTKSDYITVSRDNFKFKT